MWKQAGFKTSFWKLSSVFPQNLALNDSREMEGNQKVRRALLFFTFATSISALFWEAKQEGLLVTLKLPKNMINSKFSQASEVFLETVCCLAVLVQKAIYFFSGEGKKASTKSPEGCCTRLVCER